MLKNFFFIHEELIDVFHNKLYIPTIENLSVHLARLRIIGSIECGKNRNDYFQINVGKVFKVKEGLCRKICKITGIEI